MAIRVVESKQNARVKELRRALAMPGRVESGRVGIEGLNLLEEAMRAGLRVKTIFVAQGAERLLESLRVPPEIEVLQLSKTLLDSALATETPQPIASLVEPPDWTWAHLFGTQQGGGALIIVMAGIQDPGNLGTILRSAEAFGATGVVSLPGTVCAWNQKAVRASAGSVFRVPMVAASVNDCFVRLRENNISVWATTSRAARPADLTDFTRATALVVGNEGNGIPKEIERRADGTITIPCPGPVESLNAAVAASVLLYEASRQRSVLSGGPSDHRGVRR
jgi:TrmH family RNA methyltransferase